MKRYYIIHFIGQYIFIFILVLIKKIIDKSVTPLNHTVGPIIVKSNSDMRFNSDNFPFIISHFSDTHVNSFNPQYGNNFELCLSKSLIYKPDVYIHTGDNVDDFCTDTRPKYGHQCRNDFKEFDKIFRKYNKNFQVSLGSAGNHDMFGVFSFDSPNFNFLNTFKNLYDTPMENYEEFLVSNYKIKANDNLVLNFVSLNPFYFPTVHPVFMYFAHTWKNFLNRLETVIDQIPNNEKIIFYSHYPQSSFTSITNPISSRKSKKGRTIKELIERPNTIAFLSGHYHAQNQLFEHHGITEIEGKINSKDCQYIESIGFDVKSTNLFEIVTIDNERFVFHSINPNNSNKCLITYPVPMNQTTSHSFLDDEESFLRILCFNEKPLNIEIHGDIEGKTIKNIKKIKENVYLYEYPLLEIIREDRKRKSSKLIRHHLSFDGDWKGEIDFYSNGIIPQFEEQKNHEYSRVLSTRYFLPIIILYLLFITIPISIPFLKKEEQLYFNFLNQETTDSFKFWFLTITGFCLRLKIQRLSLRHQIILFIAVLWPIFLPLSLMETENHYGFIWNYGYYINGIFKYSEHGQYYTYLYYVYIIIPVVIASASLSVKISCFSFLESILLCMYSIFYIIGRVFYYSLSESAGLFCMYISVFTLGILVLYPILFYKYIQIFMSIKNGRNAEWYSDEISLIRLFPM